MSIGRGCEFKGIVMHKMFYALGRWHEQSRPDRDQFFQILTNNIQSGQFTIRHDSVLITIVLLMLLLLLYSLHLLKLTLI